MPCPAGRVFDRLWLPLEYFIPMVGRSRRDRRRIREGIGLLGKNLLFTSFTTKCTMKYKVFRKAWHRSFCLFRAKNPTSESVYTTNGNTLYFFTRRHRGTKISFLCVFVPLCEIIFAGKDDNLIPLTVYQLSTGVQS